FFGLLFSCHSFFPGNPANLNDSEFCDPGIEAQYRQALAAQARSPNATRLLWADIDRAVTGQAPWVPLYNQRALVVLSAGVGNYQFHPLWGLLIDQLWVRCPADRHAEQRAGRALASCGAAGRADDPGTSRRLEGTACGTIHAVSWWRSWGRCSGW